MRISDWSSDVCSSDLYILGIVLLLGVEFFGETSKGATRWLDLGIVRIQPSEMMKIAVPMMLAWYFHHKQGKISFIDFLVAGLLLLIPFALIATKPEDRKSTRLNSSH